MPVETTLYDLLDVSPDADEAEIKKAYRKKAIEHHPDKNPNDPEAARKFQDMAAAYEILNDPNSRAAYDEGGIAGMNGGRRGGGPDPADLFAQFFAAAGGAGPGAGPQFGFDFGGGRGGPSRRKGEDSVIPYEVTLEDLYNGKHVKMNMEKEALCGTCKGSGAKGNAKPKQCAKCDGNGWTFVTSQIAPSRLGSSRAVCSDCSGQGEKIREKDRCKKCKGEKTVAEKTRQEIFIEKGMADRQRIVLAGAGDQEPGIPAGDVVFVLRLTPHENFERSGHDLLTTVKVTLSEALLGFSRILVTHLDGRGIQVTSKPGKAIKSGDSIIVRGEGMPHYKHLDQKGDLYVVLEVEMPDENWMQSVDRKALEALLPPKKQDLLPRPTIVDEVDYEEGDISEFGEDEDGWEDDEGHDEYDEEDMGPPDCQPQ